MIDAPNQQGQDKGHLEQIMCFLLKEAPIDAQVIVGTEALSDALGSNVIDVSHKKDQVLRVDRYETTMEHVRPFLAQSIALASLFSVRAGTVSTPPTFHE